LAQEEEHFLRNTAQTKETMNKTLNISPNAITTTGLPKSSTVAGISTETQVAFSIISTIAILGNSLVILMFVRDKKLLKKSYNLLILCLAIADVLTAITLITNPAFVLGNAFPHPTNPVLGEIFCRVIWSRAFVFQLVVFSVYLSLALTAERWFAIVKPHKYGTFFTKKRIVIYVVSSWVWSFALTSSGVIEKSYNPSTDKICEHKAYLPGSLFRPLLGFFQVLMKVFVPCLVMIGLYIHMVINTNKSPVASPESKAKLRGKITRMIGSACFILMICFAPNQIFLVFVWAGKAKLDTKLHHVLALLNFISTCVNPFIYGMSNKHYRHHYRKILFAMCPRALGEGARVVRVDTC